MLLRASGEAIGEDVQLEGTIGRGDGGVPHGAALSAFAEAATRGEDELPRRRALLLEEVGGEPFVEAAATVGIFNGLVRVADATGIPLDARARATTVDLRAELGIDRFAGARNTARAIAKP